MADGELVRGALAAGVGLTGQLSSLGLLATSAWLISTASLRPPILTLTVAIATVRILALTRGLGRYGERLASHDLALRVLARLRVWAYRHLELLVPGSLADVPGGDLLARLVGDVDATQDLVVRVAIPLATGVLTAGAAVALSALVGGQAGLVLAAGLVATVLVVPSAASVAGRRAAGSLAVARGRLGGHLVETIEGAPDILAFGARGQALAALAAAESGIDWTLRRTALVAGVAGGLAALFAGATTVGVVAVGASEVGAHHLSAVSVAVLGFVSLAAFDSVSGLPEAFARLDAVLGAARRVGALATTPAAVADLADPLPLPTGPPVLALHGLSASYRVGGQRVIDGVDLLLAPGRRVALVGPSGAGKSTVALVLLRFVELSSGRATLDGVALASLRAADIRSLVAWAPQEPYVFAGTVASNLRLARPDASDAELTEVLESLGLDPWLAGLADGLQTVLGEHGVTVSGGERQRLGLARALLADRPILILDEPTAHLDEIGETLVRHEVLRYSAHRSLLWITHRLVGLDAFDEVVVLVDGKVAERGTVEDLSRRAGVLAELLAGDLASPARGQGICWDLGTRPVTK
jgi:ATP-binding cassette subfamily C protein CydC